MANYFDRPLSLQIPIGWIGGGTKTGLALDTAYTYNSAGKAVGFQFCAPVTSTLSKVYIFLSNVAGTPGDLTVEVRSGGTGVKPGTLLASQTVSPGTTANKWIAVTFSSPASLTRNTPYYVVVADAAGNGTNTSTICYKAGMIGSSYVSFTSRTTTDGFAAVLTNSSAWIPMVLRFGDGSVWGQPYTTNSTSASNTRVRGLKVDGLTEKLAIAGVWTNPTGGFLTGVKVYSGSKLPNDTPDLTITGGDANAGLYLFASPLTLEKNTVYRFVTTYSSNSAGIGYSQIEDGLTVGNEDVLACGIGGGTMYWCIDNGDNTWAEDKSLFPRMGLLLQDQVAIAASGGVPASRIFTGF